MAISEQILAIRFGYGVRPGGRGAKDRAALLRGLTAPDPLARRFARPGVKQRLALVGKLRKARKRRKDGKSGAEAQFRRERQAAWKWIIADMRAFLSRAALSDHGFRERLVAFWANHFTVSGKNSAIMLAHGAYLDEAIRPNISGRFADLLKAAVTHPAMLAYLDQMTSFGPHSAVGQRRGRGLNENLAREVLELHTLGARAHYTQNDVRQFAELLTGLRIGKSGFTFDPGAAEPGAERILGRSYGGGQPALRDILEFLDDLAAHPRTAAHVARKLAVHFIADHPPEDLVAGLTAAYRSSGGDLMQVYRALLAHPASGGPIGRKVKLPVELAVSSVRALDVGEIIANASPRVLRDNLVVPLRTMGQNLFRPPGPDGWSEDAADWITPAALAARIEWSAKLARRHGRATDPMRLLDDVLGDMASPALTRAVAGADERWEGVALLLVSPEFNRR
ncbi:MAG: DUF1800 family protein [Paracoccaceae bacterium]